MLCFEDNLRWPCILAYKLAVHPRSRLDMSKLRARLFRDIDYMVRTVKGRKGSSLLVVLEMSKIASLEREKQRCKEFSRKQRIESGQVVFMVIRARELLDNFEYEHIHEYNSIINFFSYLVLSTIWFAEGIIFQNNL